jgi:phosphatidylserine decarboxylase
MNLRSAFAALFSSIAAREDLNFLLTNRIPRALATRWMGWFSRIEQPLVRDLSIGAWRLIADLDLSDAKKERFDSLHDCFTRELCDGARPVDADPCVLASPCDAIVGAAGRVRDAQVFQAKGFPYTLRGLFDDAAFEERYRDGTYATLRLTAAMYHRFHAPYDCTVDRVTYISGDTWNVNPIALRRIEALFCKNERAILSCRLAPGDELVTLIPVAAILVASIRLPFVGLTFGARYDGPKVIDCNAQLAKGEPMGWFEHGSTIIVFAPPGFVLCDGLADGTRIRAGQALMKVR